MRNLFKSPYAYNDDVLKKNLAAKFLLSVFTVRRVLIKLH